MNSFIIGAIIFSTVFSANLPSAARSGEAAHEISQQERLVAEAVNERRAETGLAPLNLSAKLSRLARIKSEDMIKYNYFGHDSPTYGSVAGLLNKFQVPFSAAGENVAYGQTSTESVMRSWTSSEGHLKNILNPKFTEIGVGRAEDASGVVYWTQIFTGP